MKNNDLMINCPKCGCYTTGKYFQCINCGNVLKQQGEFIPQLDNIVYYEEIAEKETGKDNDTFIEENL